MVYAERHIHKKKSVKIEPTLEETDEMPIEYLNQDEKAFN